ncbi:carnitine transporter [Entophlyctis sp. JEL0112]|nr:carnitine transporter [Entophlyctis sp. JEL0112]
MGVCYTSYSTSAAIFQRLHFEHTGEAIPKNTAVLDTLPIQYVALAGAFASLPTSLILAPAERIKILMQVETASPASPSSRNPLVSIWRAVMANGGLNTLFRGTAITMLRDFPGDAAYFGTFEAAKRALKAAFPQNNSSFSVSDKYTFSPWQIVMAGGCAGIANWLVCFPIDSIKTQVQQSSTGSATFWSVVKSQKSFFHLYRGLTPVLVKEYILLGDELDLVAATTAATPSSVEAPGPFEKDFTDAAECATGAGSVCDGGYDGSYVHPNLWRKSIEFMLTRAPTPAERAPSTTAATVAATEEPATRTAAVSLPELLAARARQLLFSGSASASVSVDADDGDCSDRRVDGGALILPPPSALAAASTVPARIDAHGNSLRHWAALVGLADDALFPQPLQPSADRHQQHKLQQQHQQDQQQIRNFLGETPLMRAVTTTRAADRPDAFLAVVAAHAVNEQDLRGRTVLHHAVLALHANPSSRMRRATQFYLQTLTPLVDSSLQDANGDTALHIACRVRDPSIARQLLSFLNAQSALRIRNSAGLDCADLGIDQLLSAPPPAAVSASRSCSDEIQEETSATVKQHRDGQRSTNAIESGDCGSPSESKEACSSAVVIKAIESTIHEFQNSHRHTQQAKLSNLRSTSATISALERELAVLQQRHGELQSSTTASLNSLSAFKTRLKKSESMASQLTRRAALLRGIEKELKDAGCIIESSVSEDQLPQKPAAVSIPTRQQMQNLAAFVATQDHLETALRSKLRAASQIGDAEAKCNALFAAAFGVPAAEASVIVDPVVDWVEFASK